MPKLDAGYESFAIISIDSLLVYNSKYNLQIYLDNCAHKLGNKQIANYPDDNLFED